MNILIGGVVIAVGLCVTRESAVGLLIVIAGICVLLYG